VVTTSYLVVDASVVAMALSAHDALGLWCRAQMRAGCLTAPSMLLAEVASTLRRQVIARKLSEDNASLAYAQLLQLPITLAPYAPFGARIWALRANVRPYDAWYAALAEYLGAPLATLDLRLARASGPTCTFRTPP
jgi:predicted nucleic acid-binding protein